jgi:rsbT antagonist protein RsbS
MNTPILKIGPYLIASLRPDLSDSDLLALEQALIERVGTARARGVVLNVSTLDVMDSFAARTLRNIAQAVGLRGARAVVAGIQPEVALAMMRLGLDLRLSGVLTALDLEEALALLDQQNGQGGLP